MAYDLEISVLLKHFSCLSRSVPKHLLTNQNVKKYLTEFIKITRQPEKFDEMNLLIDPSSLAGCFPISVAEPIQSKVYIHQVFVYTLQLLLFYAFQ